MVVEADIEDRLRHAFDPSQQIETPARMRAHDGKLHRCEGAGFCEDRDGDGGLADVVQQAAQRKIVHLSLIHI